MATVLFIANDPVYVLVRRRVKETKPLNLSCETNTVCWPLYTNSIEFSSCFASAQWPLQTFTMKHDFLLYDANTKTRCATTRSKAPEKTWRGGQSAVFTRRNLKISWLYAETEPKLGGVLVPRTQKIGTGNEPHWRTKQL